MKIETLRERIAKANDKITKKECTIIKKEGWIEKKTTKLEKTTDEHERYWLSCEIRNLESDIVRIKKEIEETKHTIEKYEKQLSGELEKEKMFINEVPEAMKDLESILIEKWDESDLNRRDYYREQYKELGYKDFIKKYRYSAYEFMHQTEKDFHKANEKDARTFILDLVNRVKDITGEITDWNGVHLTVGTNGFPVLNGFVIGKEGRAEVESIFAGGYNIQRLHVRVLVKSI